MDTLRILTYNSTGLGGNKCDYISNLLDKFKIDVLMLQETWLLKGNLQLLSSINRIYDSYGISGVNEDNILLGRPYGGLGFLWRKDMTPYITRIQTGCKRICAINLKCKDVNILLINAYMPVDHQSKTHTAEEFISTCDVIEVLANKYNNSILIIGGDLNIDFRRKNANDIYFMDLLQRLELILCWDLNCAKQDYTFYSPQNNSTSILDHFCFDQRINRLVKEVSVVDCPLNPSGHRPVMIDVWITPLTVLDKHKKVPRTNAIVWHKVTDDNIEHYKHLLDNKLQNIAEYNVTLCKDLSCDQEDHKQQIDAWCNNIVNCCLEADRVFPRRKSLHNKPCKPEYNDYVRHCREDCIWWYNAWREIGKPMHGDIFENMKRSKKQYMYAERRRKRHESEIKFQKMAECIKDNQTRDFFNEVKRMTNNRPNMANSMNGEMSPKKIADNLATKYQTLYNSVPSDDLIMQNINKEIVNGIHTERYESAVVSQDNIRMAIGKLKKDKKDGDKGLNSYHLIHGTDILQQMLAALFTCIITHGYQPTQILNSTILSIPKDPKGDLCTDKNYRGIALMSSIAKTFDLILLERNVDVLMTSDRQFAFKAKHGTALCTLTVKEVINYYLQKGARVAGCFIDATKAFDRVRFDKLFQLLINNRMNVLDLRALIDLYHRQQTRTYWEGHTSAYFSTSNGIRQGGIASPVLYCIYMDYLLNKLKDEGVGCWIGSHYVGAICYADDLTLLCPSVYGLQKMIQICETYGEQFGMQYNPTKSVCVMFTKQRQGKEYSEVKLSGNRLS